MNLPNTQYPSGKFFSTKANNPCPICEDTKGKCRTVGTDFVLCMTHPTDVGLDSWKYLGETSGGYYGGKYVRVLPESESEREARRAANLKLRIAQQKAKRERLTKLPDAQKKDQIYRHYLQKLSLDNLDQADLLRRGLSEQEIINLGAKSIKNGYILPITNPNSQILGFQTRLRDPSSGRYLWHKPFGMAAHQQNGELPLAFHGHLQDIYNHLVLVEGTGVKPYLASKLRHCPAIGAAGGQFIASSKTLQSYLDSIGAKPLLTKLEYAIDAGDIVNPAVMRRHEKNLDFLVDLGYEINVLWWGQVAKTDNDIDELTNGEDIQLLTIEQFYQIANYQPKPKFAPWQWLQDKLFTKTKAQGFRNKSNKSQEPKQPRTVAVSQTPIFEYELGHRLQAWQDLLQTHKHVLDCSATGTGKTHDVGSLSPELLGVDKIIYISNDSRNVATDTLQDWQLLPARHHGLTNKQGKLRLAKRGESVDTMANCSRTAAINALKNKGIADTQIVCETCPLLNACRHSLGDGFGFRHERAIAFKSNILRSHPASLPSPDDYDYSKTLLVWEEVSESLSTLHQIQVDSHDIDQMIAKLSRSGLENQQDFIKLLNKLHDLLSDQSRYGLNFHQIKAAIPDVLDRSVLGDLLKPDLSMLDTVDGIADFEFEQSQGKLKRNLAKVNALLKRETTLNSMEVEQTINREVLKQWLPEFIDILSGATQFGDLHIHRGKLTVSLLDQRLRHIANQAWSNLYLDATVSASDLQMRLAAEVYMVQQLNNLPMPTIYQVSDLGRMTMQRGNEQVRKVKEIVEHLQAIDPSTKVIDFKKFADGEHNIHTVDGVWFRDSRGSNDFKEAKTLVITGTPCPNLSALRSEYVTLTGLQPQADDPDFADFIDCHILANIQQCFGRKSGNRFQDGDKIYFLSDFNLGIIPHTQISASDITPKAMSKLENLKAQVVEMVNKAISEGFDLVAASERQVADWLEISRGSLRYHSNWINPLLGSLYSSLIQDSKLVSSLPVESEDMELIELWSGIVEGLLAEGAPLKVTLVGVMEFFADYIPQYLHHFVVLRLSVAARNSLFSALALFAVKV